MLLGALKTPLQNCQKPLKKLDRFLSFVMHTIRTFTANGPYFPPTTGIYQASCLRDIIFHTRLAMEDGEYQIGLFDDNGQCKGMWVDEAEPDVDGEGRSILGECEYVLYRPGDMSAGLWSLHLSKFKQSKFKQS